MISVVDKVIQAKVKKIKAYPCHTNRASELGHPCDRYLYYCRMNWSDRALHSADLQFIFDQGKAIEAEAVRELEEAGFIIMEQRRPFEWKQYQITGTLDLKIAEAAAEIAGRVDKAYPTEIKGLQHHDWVKLDCIEDFLISKKQWIKKYPAQLTLYMLMDNSPEGLFYIKSKSNFKPKEIWITLDYTFAEELVQKAERVNAAVAKKAIPDRIPYDDEVCGRCSFAHICLTAGDFGKGATFMDSDELLGWLKRREELDPLRKEFKEVDENIKEMVKEIETVIIGPYVITGKWHERKEYKVEATKYWSVKIINPERKNVDIG